MFFACITLCWASSLLLLTAPPTVEARQRMCPYPAENKHTCGDSLDRLRFAVCEQARIILERYPGDLDDTKSFIGSMFRFGGKGHHHSRRRLARMRQAMRRLYGRVGEKLDAFGNTIAKDAHGALLPSKVKPFVVANMYKIYGNQTTHESHGETATKKPHKQGAKMNNKDWHAKKKDKARKHPVKRSPSHEIPFNIVCECCYHQCSIMDVLEYCFDDLLS